MSGKTGEVDTEEPRRSTEENRAPREGGQRKPCSRRAEPGNGKIRTRPFNFTRIQGSGSSEKFESPVKYRIPGPARKAAGFSDRSRPR